jgi:hypothetical protein
MENGFETKEIRENHTHTRLAINLLKKCQEPEEGGSG